jgi:branched-chain amino acid transport system permease protein
MNVGNWEYFFQLITGGLSIGSIYALIAIGFVLIYKTTGVLNFAQGELMMLGAYFCFTVIVYLKLSFFPAFILSLIISAFLGYSINIIAIRPMVGKPIFSIVMITIGLSTIIRHSVSLIWGHLGKEFPSPFSIEKTVSFSGVYISTVHLWTIVFGSIFVLFFYLFFRFSVIGIGMKATGNDQVASMIQGINVRKMLALSWAIAAVTSTVAGCFLASYSYLHPEMGLIGLKAFPAIILGGLDSVGGAIIGGLAIGLIENLAGGYLDKLLGGGIKEITSFVIVLLVMMIRPYGLFGKKHIDRV